MGGGCTLVRLHEQPHSGSAPTIHVVSCRLQGGKERGKKKELFLEAAKCSDGDRKKTVFNHKGVRIKGQSSWVYNEITVMGRPFKLQGIN